MVLPCWDETDNGVPDFCLENELCPFHPHNPYTNDNCVCHVFGNIGWQYFDHARKRWMGLAMWSTLLAMFVTTYGALSLSSDQRIVRVAYWLRMDTSYAEVYVNGTLVDDDGALLNGTVDTLGDGARAFLGLCAIVTVHDGEITRDKWDHNYMIGSINRKSKESPVQRLQDEVLDECRASMEGIQIGALLGCVTLIFGLVGTINRMRFASDANVQKGLGLITDTWGALALGYTLLNFSSQCYWDLPPSYRDGATKYDLEYAFGPGFYCYVFCAGSGLIRAAAHWLTPTPGNGSGVCKAGLPEYLLVGTRHHADFDEAPKDAEPAPAAVFEEPTPSTPGRLTPRRASKRISMAWGAGDAPLGTETPLTWAEARAICRERRDSIKDLRTAPSRAERSPMRRLASRGAYSPEFAAAVAEARLSGTPRDTLARRHSSPPGSRSPPDRLSTIASVASLYSEEFPPARTESDPLPAPPPPPTPDRARAASDGPPPGPSPDREASDLELAGVAPLSPPPPPSRAASSPVDLGSSRRRLSI